MKLIRLTLLNMKKRMGANAAIFLLIALTAMFLSIGFNIMKETSNVYSYNKAQLGEPDNAYIMSQAVYKQDYFSYLQKDKTIEKTECDKLIALENAKITYPDGTIETPSLFFNVDEQQGMLKAHIREEIEVPEEQAIYIPASMQQYGFTLGNTIAFQYKGNVYQYTIAGVTDTTLFGAINSGSLKYYLKDAGYKQLAGRAGESYGLFVKMNPGADGTKADKSFQKFIRENADSNAGSSMINRITWLESEAIYSYMGYILAGVLFVFSIVIAATTILVVRFRIINTIEDGMIQIGTLQALGYKGFEVVMVFLQEYLFLALAGGIIGVILSYGVMPLVGNIISGANGLLWFYQIHLQSDVCISLGILLLIGIISLLTTRRIYKYPPVTALSKGIKQHGFKKNFFPLEYCKQLHIWLAAKQMSGSIKQNIMIIFCITGVTFATMLGVYLYIGFGVDRASVKKVAGLEFVDVNIRLNNGVDEHAFVEDIANLKEVRKAGLSKGYVQMSANQESVYVDVYDNCERLETVETYEGRLPQYDNEVVITGVLAQKWKKDIGDTVNIEYNGCGAEYLITGLSQTFSNGGNMLKVTEEGMKRIAPAFRLDTVDVYLKDKNGVEDFIKLLNERYGLSSENAAEKMTDTSQMTQDEKIKQVADEKIAQLMKVYGVESVDYSVLVDGKLISGNSRKYAVESIVNFERVINATLKQFAAMFGTMTLAILIATMMIIGLMLALIMRALIMQRKVQYGIFKALGFTTHQVMFQIAGSLMPAVIVGVITGTLLNHVLINKMTNLAIGSMGISHMEYHIPPVVIIGMMLFLCMYSFLVAMINAYKVRKITPYELLTE